MSGSEPSHAEDAPAPEARLDVLFVRVAGTRWAVEAGYVGRIVETFDVHPVPRTPPAVTGMTDVEGEVAAVVDAAAVVDPDRSPGATDGPLVTLHREEGDGVGLRVGAVEDLASVDVSRIDPVARDDGGAAGDGAVPEPTVPDDVDALLETGDAVEDASASATREPPTATASGSVARWSRALVVPEGDDGGDPVGVLDVPYLLQTVANNSESRNQ